VEALVRYSATGQGDDAEGDFAGFSFDGKETSRVDDRM
jgi:hypothetical protein